MTAMIYTNIQMLRPYDLQAQKLMRSNKVNPHSTLSIIGTAKTAKG